MKVKSVVEAFLAERGLVLSPEKTKITHVSAGFDFLGQNVRRYPNGKLLIKPSRKSIARLLTETKRIVREHQSMPAALLIMRLNPVIRGWASYHRHVVSKRIFARIDNAIFQQLWRWACARHPRKGRRWIKNRYFDRVRNRDWWFFGTDASQAGSTTRFRLFHATSVKIVRHVCVREALNPYDLAWFDYLADRTRRRSATTAAHHAPSCLGLSRVSWKLSRTVLRGGVDGGRRLPTRPGASGRQEQGAVPRPHQGTRTSLPSPVSGIRPAPMRARW